MSQPSLAGLILGMSVLKNGGFWTADIKELRLLLSCLPQTLEEATLKAIGETFQDQYSQDATALLLRLQDQILQLEDEDAGTLPKLLDGLLQHTSTVSWAFHRSVQCALKRLEETRKLANISKNHANIRRLLQSAKRISSLSEHLHTQALWLQSATVGPLEIDDAERIMEELFLLTLIEKHPLMVIKGDSGRERIQRRLPDLPMAACSELDQRLKPFAGEEVWLIPLWLEQMAFGTRENRERIFSDSLDLARHLPVRERQIIIQCLLDALEIRPAHREILLCRLSPSEHLLPDHCSRIVLQPGQEQVVVLDGERLDTQGINSGIPLRLLLQPSGELVLHWQKTQLELPLLVTCQVGDLTLYRPQSDTLIAMRHPPAALSLQGFSSSYHDHLILDDLLLNFHLGEFVAITGASGCGKTTLLMALANQIQGWQGQVTFRGKPQSARELARQCVYIPQDDILWHELSVGEAIESAARMRVRNDAHCRHKVSQLLEVLGLEEIRNLQIGNESLKGISGGQRKRTNIGVALAGALKPILLFDEPTASLDPATAREIIQLLRRLSRQGHLVLCVTHDISGDLLDWYDRLVALNVKGRVCYTGSPQQAQGFFKTLSAESLHRKLSSDESLRERYLLSHLAAEEAQDVKRESQHLQLAQGKTQPRDSDERVSFLAQLSVILQREWRRKIRDRSFLGTAILQPMLISLILCLFFKGPLANGLFSMCVASLWIGSISSIREINGDWAQIRRECRSKQAACSLYGGKLMIVSFFSFAQVLVMVLLTCLTWGCTLPPFFASLLLISASLLLLNLYGAGLGFLLSILAPTPLASASLLPVILVPLLVSGGALSFYSEHRGFPRAMMTHNPLRLSYESLIAAHQRLAILPASTDSKRSEAEADKQLARLLRWHPDNPGSQNNQKLAEILGQSPRPAKAETVDEPELLQDRKDLWLAGYRTLPVAQANAQGLGHKIALVQPGLFVAEPNARGWLGLYSKEDNLSWSITSPLSRWLSAILQSIGIPLLCVFFLLRRLRQLPGKK